VYPADLDQDRALILPFSGGLLLAVADGAGGIGGGAEAADLAVSWLAEHSSRLVSAAPEELCCLLTTLDGVLLDDRSAGETTLVLALVRGDEVVGASVGDSEAWLIGHEGYAALTEDQRRKPLLGSGEAFPVAFHAELEGRSLLLGTDGLFRYAKPAALCAAVATSRIADLPAALVAAIRLQSGTLQDDVALAVCRLQQDTAVLTACAGSSDDRVPLVLHTVDAPPEPNGTREAVSPNPVRDTTPAPGTARRTAVYRVVRGRGRRREGLRGGQTSVA
jgi:serine/threonine protein phosphatase PrpC